MCTIPLHLYAGCHAAPAWRSRLLHLSPASAGSYVTSRSIRTAVVLLCGMALVASPAWGQRRQAECFKAEYSQPVGQVFAELFPARIALHPGTKSGRVETQRAPTDTTGFWRMFQWRAGWTRPTADSLQLSFSNGFTGIPFDLARSGDGYEGTVTIYYDFTVDTVPSMHVRLTPEKCPAHRPRSSGSMRRSVRRKASVHSAPAPRSGTHARP
jgi:hypothetical protein